MSARDFLKYAKAQIKKSEHQNEREDYRTGLICATIANVNRPKGKTPYKPQDFMPRKRRKLTTNEIFNKLFAITQMHNGNVNIAGRS